MTNTLENKLRTAKNQNVSIIAFTLLIGLFWIRQILWTYVLQALTYIPVIRTITSSITPILFCVLIFFSLPYILSKSKGSDIIFLLIVIAIYLSHFLLFPDNSQVLTENIRFLYALLPLYFLGLSLDAKKYYKYLYYLSVLNIIFLMIFKLFIADVNEDLLLSGDMAAAYNMLPHLCLVTYGMLRKPSVLNVIVSIIGSGFLLTLGCRGAVLCYGFFIIFYIVFFNRSKHRFWIVTLLIVALLLLVYNIVTIMSFFGEIARDLGLSSRIFDKFADEELFELSNRDSIQTKLYEAIDQNLLGIGLGGDRIIANNYAHNIAIELCVAFGLIFGSFIFLILVAFLLRGILAKRPQEEKFLVYILFFSSFVKLFLSNSFLLEGMLYLLLGQCVSLIRNSAREKHLTKCENRYSKNVTLNTIK